MKNTALLNIGLLGYGKMGKIIDAIATAQGHTIAWRIDETNKHTLTTDLLKSADVVIEFSRPEVAFEHVMMCLNAGVPVVSGTTGWLADLEKAQAHCQTVGGTMLWSSNFSIGVNIFFAVNKYLAELLSQHTDYQVDMTEVHHVHKLDAPSGTAVSLARQVMEKAPRYAHWQLKDGATATDSIPIEAIREGEVPGTHIVHWASAVDEITIEHRAHTREGFAKGAVLAATWLPGKKGVFNMSDVLGI